MSPQPKSTLKRHLSKLANAYAPWPLGTDAMVRILAWPDYAKPAQIQRVLKASSRLFGHKDACLCLRYHHSIDIPLEQAVKNIEAEVQNRNVEQNGSQDINILIVDDDIPKNEWYRVGLTSFCTVGLSDEPDTIRNEFIRLQRSEIIFV